MLAIVGSVKFINDTQSYKFNLENNDTIFINKRNMERIMLHKSIRGFEYVAVYDVHEDRADLPITYAGFKMIS